jgi:phage terminase large subunit-like protein
MRTAQFTAAAGSMASLKAKEEIDVREAYALQIELEMERRRRAREAEEGPQKIQATHQAFRAAFPLRQYIREVFPILEPGREYKDNWHIDCICELLEAATVGEIKHLLINLPRRCMKSTLISVVWMTWAWTFLPWTRWLFASYSEKFAHRDSNHCRHLIESNYYQKRFGDVFRPSERLWKTSEFANDKGGKRSCFGVGKGTGDGGDFVVVDDPHQIDEAESTKVIEKTITWYFETYYNNVTDPETAVRAIMHQRVAEEDLTGVILARELGYELLCLPMRYEDDHPHKNSVSKPLQLGKVSVFEAAKLQQEAAADVSAGDVKEWIDPRDPQAPTFTNKWYRGWYKTHFASRDLKSEGEGQILWPNRFQLKHINDMVAHLKAYGESAQLQQRPIRRGGNFFRSENFTEITKGELDLTGVKLVRYWDKAGTEAGGDWTVGMLMARSMKRPYLLTILDIYRAQIGLYARLDIMKELAEADTADYITNGVAGEYSVAIEKEGASSGKDLATIERDHLAGFDVVIDIPRGNKAHRAGVPKSLSEGGRIRMLAGTVWRTAFIKEIEKFDPAKDSQVDDQVDTLSGCCRKLIFSHESQGSSSGGSY